ncbi:MAG: hypothetical protein MNPFHGCM_02433 [Gemmatimonadaceae bacterium]|nr:hypothetical protein [Gemmatimonadaceae bacterium]
MKRTFTVDQANRMLPLVERIVRDIVTHHERWQQVVGEFELANLPGTVQGSAERALRLQEDAERLAADIQGFVGELEELGVEFKSFDLGLVDFPSIRDGRAVLLCWKLNEPAVAHWHEISDGFSGRQPLLRAV